MAKDEFVILVDDNDLPAGKLEKMEAHRKGLLHRAFSIFIFNDRGELMLQQRAISKYHSPGLWTNTCCSHPRIDEDTQAAAHRRLKEEMGFDCDLQEIFSFTYKADVGNGLTEHEFDHVLVGVYNHPPRINRNEVENWKNMAMADIKKDMLDKPEDYTIWFRIAFVEIENYFSRIKK
jgi:isopentenyl-diphosphate delta-isomerase